MESNELTQRTIGCAIEFTGNLTTMKLSGIKQGFLLNLYGTRLKQGMKSFLL